LAEISDIIQPYILRFKEIKPELDEKIQGTQQRQKKRAYYQSFSTEESIRYLKKPELDEFFTNLWAFVYWENKEKQLKVIFDKGQEYVKNELVKLLFGKESVEIRYENFIKNVSGAGPAITSELLCWKFPDTCAIWNTPVDNSLKMLDFKDLPFKPSMRKAIHYGPFCKFARIILEEMKKNGFPDADLSMVDYLFYSISGYGSIKNTTLNKDQLLSNLTKFLIQSQTDNLQTTGYFEEFLELPVRISFGQGRKARVSWICLLKSGQEIQNGYYPSFYYDIGKSSLFTVFGVSETKKPKKEWPPEIAREHKTFSELDVSQDIAQKYPNSRMFHEYPIKKDAIEESLYRNITNIFQDCLDLVEMYTGGKVPSNRNGLFDYYVQGFQVRLPYLDQTTGYETLSGGDLRRWIRNEVSQKFSKNTIDDITLDDILNIFIHFNAIRNYTDDIEGRKQWILSFVKGVGLDQFKERLKDLLFGKDEFSIRHSRFIKNIKDLGLGITSDILSYSWPSEFASYNSCAEKALEILQDGKRENNLSKSNVSSYYLDFQQRAQSTLGKLRTYSSFKDADYITLDYFLYYVSMVRYWQFSPGSDAQYWEYQKQKNIAGIYFREYLRGEDEKLFTLTKDQLFTHFKQRYADTTKQSSNLIYKFIHDCKPGDFFIANKGMKSTVGWTILKEGPSFNTAAQAESPEDEYTLYYSTEWQEKKVENIPVEIGKKFYTTLSEINFEQFSQLLTGKPGNGDPSIKDPRKKQVILYGPPGTGKTYSSVIKAHEIIFGNKDDTITYRLLQEKLRKQQKSTIDLSQLTWIQAIILAFDEINKEKVQVDEIKNATIIRDFSSYKNNQYVSNTIWAILQAESALDSTTVKLKNKSGREYFDKDTESNWYLTEKGKEFQQNLINDLQESPETSDSQFSFITFHQSFSYEDFVEGIRPELNNADESAIVYRVKDGIFKEICKKALKDPGNNYVLVIDEINRGNISKIFGELITLLEDNKRIGEREEIIVRLPYSNESFGVPGNVYIIGTMNSTDKSIALVDIALRRRFHFERLAVDYELIQNSDAKAFLQELNSIICALKNADYEIGHYYFMNIPVEDPGNQALKQVFSNQILPLLEEYFFNDWEALATILGRDAITIETKKKFVWDDDSGKFEEETGDYDKIHGRCLKPLDAVFESAMNNLVIKKGTLEHNP
jgi:hypothetical protein